MDTRTIAKISDLKNGDRFYKPKDAKKRMWTVVPVKPKKNKWTTLQFGAVIDGEKFPQYFKSETEVMFMRHTNPQ